MRQVTLVWRVNRQRWFSDFDWSQRCWCQLISLQIWQQTEYRCDLARHSFCPMLITWAEVEYCFLESACHTGLSASSESQLCLPLFLFLSWFREKCSHTILRKSAKKPLHSVSLSPVCRVPAKLLSTQFCVCNGSEVARGRPRSMHCALAVWVAAFTTRVTHHPSMSIPTVFLRTNSLPSTASLTLPSPSLPPQLHLPSACHSDRSDACPLSVAQIAL